MSIRLTGKTKKSYGESKLLGEKFGSLLVSGFDGRDESGHTYWRCRCACGKFTVVRTDNLISGRTKSCDCKQFGGLNV